MACASGLGEDFELWPLGKLSTRLKAFKEPFPKLGFAAILTTGAMNPLHRGHLQLLHQAKVRLEAEGFGVLGAWLSPSHDGYVQPKAKSLKTVGLSAGFRIQAARLTAAADELVDVGSWEASQPGGWPDFPEVTAALKAELESTATLAEARDKGVRVTVFYACGTDHAAKCGLYRGLGAKRGLGVVVVPRDGEKPLKGDCPEDLVYIAEPAGGEVASFSSTKLRQALERGDEDYIASAMSPDAAQFLLHPTAEHHAIFQDDFAKVGLPPPTAAA